MNQQKTQKYLFLDETYGDNLYCYVCSHSLTGEIQFIIFFYSYESVEVLNLFLWPEQQTIVLDTGKSIYLIDFELKIKRSLDIISSLIGIYLINQEELLLLEEVSSRIIDFNGIILKEELFDLIEKFSISDNVLFIQTEQGMKNIEL